jgi:hypothetical protein
MIQNAPQAKSMFLVGTGFWKTSKILSNYLGNAHDFDVVAPIFVNLSFAGEVYLKCLHLIRTGILLKGHDLRSLFNKLPETDKTLIENAYNNKVNRSPVVQAMKTHSPTVDLKLSTVLAEAGDTFEKFRYVYEHSPNAPKTLGEFVDALQEHLRDVDPTLESALHVPFRKQSSGRGKSSS